MCLLTEPALGLVNKTILVVIDSHRADCAFTEVEDFVTVRWPFASDGSRLVVAIEVILIGPIAEFYAFKQLIGDVRVTGGIEESWEPVQSGEDAVLHGICRHMTGPAQNARHAEAAFEDRPLGLSEWCCSAIGPGEKLGAIIGGKDDDGIIVNAEILQLLHNQTDVVIELGHACFL